jgi:hypothetical protein
MNFETLNRAYQNREDRNEKELETLHNDNVKAYNGNIDHLKEGWVAPKGRKIRTPFKSSFRSVPFFVETVTDKEDDDRDDNANDFETLVERDGE